MKARTFIVISFALLFVTAAVGGIAYDFDWPRWRGPNGDGISHETDWNPKALAGGPKILWKVKVGIGHSNVAIKDDRLYTMGGDFRNVTIYCLDAKTGGEIWQYSFESAKLPFSTPIIECKHIYVTTNNGILLCLKAKNGKLKWKKDIINEYSGKVPRWEYAGSPVIEGDLIILTFNNYGLALHKKTGNKVWVSPPNKLLADTCQYFTPVIFNYQGKRYGAFFPSEGLYIVEVDTGKQIWYYPWDSYPSHAADPIVFDNKVFISTGYNFGCALIKLTDSEAKVLWKNWNMGNHFSTCVLVDGFLYGTNGNVGGLLPFRCIDFETGEVMWEKKMKMVSLMAADGKLIMLEENGTLHIAEATSSAYKEISSCDVLVGEKKHRQFWTPPVLCNALIYCRNYEGDLVCIDVSK